MKKAFLITLLLIPLLFSFNYVYSQVNIGGNTPKVNIGGNTPKTSDCPPGKLCNPLKVKSIEEAILLAVDIAIYIGVAFAILAIIFVGFKFVAAQGNETKLKDAKLWFLWIVIGLAVLISARVIVEIIKNTLIASEVVNKDVF
ncbi:MAG TPA: hypothetical protein VJI66_01970 [Candidatus Paceibacterota bacterium]